MLCVLSAVDGALCFDCPPSSLYYCDYRLLAKLTCDLGPLGNRPRMMCFQKASCFLPGWRLELVGKPLECDSSLMLRSRHLFLLLPPVRSRGGISLLVAITSPLPPVPFEQDSPRGLAGQACPPSAVTAPPLGLHFPHFSSGLSLNFIFSWVSSF